LTWHTKQNEIPLATKITLKRGFKANAERLAKEYREKLNIHPCAALCAFKLADHLGIEVCKATEFVNSAEHVKLLSGASGQKCEWSALTMVPASGKQIIIHNQFHSEARQQSDIMHELAHIICGHKHTPKEHDFELPIGLRSYDPVKEEEAKCLGATLQLATPCLLWATKRNMTHEEISNYFNSSIDMVKYRMNMTGIARRYRKNI
jgi:Zn-dependent peptidase ImmA (M78 family)